MAGSPSQEAAERNSRKRRAPQALPDKAKKSTTSSSPFRTDMHTNKVARSAPTNTKSPANPEPSTTGGTPATDDKPESSVPVGRSVLKGTKSDVTGKPSKNKSEKVPVKDNKTDDKEKPASKKDDANDKADAKNKSNKGKPPYSLSCPCSDHDPFFQASATNLCLNVQGSEMPKASQGVKLPDLVKPVPSDSENSTDDDSDDSDDSDNSDDSVDSCDSHLSSESDDSDDTSHVSDYLDEDLYDASVLDSDEIQGMNPERIASEKEKTLRHVRAFIDTTKDKHYHEFRLETLTGPNNYVSWLVGLEVLLRMHQVWPVVGELSVPLDKDHEMYPWYEHMLNVAVSLIYANVSQEIRSQRCFMSSVMDRNPNNMMQHIWAHFGQQGSGESHSH